MTVNGSMIRGGASEWSSFLTVEIPQQLIAHVPVRLTLSSRGSGSDSGNGSSSVVCVRTKTHEDVLDSILLAVLAPAPVPASANSTANTVTELTCNGTAWKIGHCSASLTSLTSLTSRPVLCAGCSNPCSDHHSTDFLIIDTFDSVDTVTNSLALEFDPILAPPAITAMDVSSPHGNGLIVHVVVSEVSGSVRCTAQFSDATATDIFTFVSHGADGDANAVEEDVRSTHFNLTLVNLVPSSSYDVHCQAYSRLGQAGGVSSMAEVLGVTTQCCRVLTASLTASYFTDTEDVSDALVVDIGTHLPTDITITVTALYSSVGFVNVSDLTHPFLGSVVHFSNASFSSIKTLAFTQHPAGFYQLMITLSGMSAVFYEVSYPRGVYFEVLISHQQPQAPELVSAIFSPEGSVLLVHFSGNTDRAGDSRSNTKDCTRLVEVAGLKRETPCHWRSDTCLALSLSGNKAAVVGDPLRLRGGVLRAKCDRSLSECDGWRVNNARTVNITSLPLQTLLPPVVVMAGPAALGPCDDMHLDLSGSRGAGGRHWATVSWEVETLSSLNQHSTDSNTTATSAAPVAAYLNNVTDISVPISIPSALLEPEQAYNVIVTLCNFLNRCHRGALLFSVGSVDLVPVVALHSPRVRSVFRHLPLEVSGDARIQPCGGIISSSQNHFQFTWQLFNSAAELVDSSSLTSAVSVDPAVFLLPAHSLEVGVMYELVLRAQLKASPHYSSSSSMLLTVLPGSIVVRLNVSSAFGLRVSDPHLVIDASNSWDADAPAPVATDTGYGTGPDTTGGSGIGDATLAFHFLCRQLLPRVHTDCDLDLAPVGPMAVAVSVPNNNISYVDNVYEITVHVSHHQDSRTSSLAVEVTILPDLAAVVSLVHASAQGSVANPSDKQIITASVDYPHPTAGEAVWKVVDDPFFDLQASALSPTAVSLLATGQSNTTSSLSIFALVLASNSLLAWGEYTFSLQVTLSSGLTTTAAVTIETNTPPVSGLFVVSPPSGIELNTSFLFAASQWTDGGDGSGLPLSYAFAAHSASTDSYAVFRSRRQLTTTVAVLAAGQGRGQSQARVQVYDTLDGQTTAFASVHVEPAPAPTAAAAAANVTTAVRSRLRSLLLNASASGSLRHTVYLASAVLNTVECEGADNCTALHRSPCGATAHQCGPCLPGFFGEDGASNAQCYLLTPDPTTTTVSAAAALFSSSSSSSSLVSCSNDTECALHLLEECRTDQASCSDTSCCAPALKFCDSNCSGHGTCRFVSLYYPYSEDSNSEAVQELEECAMLDDGCIAWCECSPLFAGEACEVPVAEHTASQSLRHLLVQSFAHLVDRENPSSDTVLSWVQGLAGVATTSSQLTEAAMLDLIALTSRVLDYSYMVQLSYEDISIPVMKLLDLMLTPSPPPLGTAVSAPASLDAALQLLRQVAEYMRQDLVVGQHPSSVLTRRPPRYRLAASSVWGAGQGQGQSLQLSQPRSTRALLTGVASQSVTLSPSTPGPGDKALNVSVLLVESVEFIQSRVFNISQHLSVPLEVVISRSATWPHDESRDESRDDDDDNDGNNSSALSYSMQIVLTHFEVEVEFLNETEQHLTTCLPSPVSASDEAADEHHFSYACHDGGNVTASCNGTMHGILVTDCPSRVPTSECHVLAASSPAVLCRTLAYSSQTTTCECVSGANASVMLTSVANYRLTESTTRYYPAASVQSGDVNGASTRDVNGVLAVVTLSLTCAVVLHVTLSLFSKEKSTQPSGDELGDYNAMLDKGLSPIFSSSSSLSRRVLEEVSRHHRWVSFLKQSLPSACRRWRFLCVLSQIIVSCFLLSVVYGAGVESASSCERGRESGDEAECTASPRWLYEGHCMWTEGEAGEMDCLFREPTERDQRYLCFVALVLSIFTGPLFVVLENCLWYSGHGTPSSVSPSPSPSAAARTTAALQAEYHEMVERMHLYAWDLSHVAHGDFLGMLTFHS